MKSDTTVKEFAQQYLQNRYSSDFEFINISKASAPGEKFSNYEIKCRSLSHDRRDFYVTVTKKDSFKIHIDQYPIILLEEAFLERLDIKNNKDFTGIFEIEGRFVIKDYLDGINNLNDAKAKLKSIDKSSWLFLIYTTINKVGESDKEIEDRIVHLLSQAYEILPAATTANIYIYSDTSLSKTNLQPDMNKGMVHRTPHQTKIYQEWIVGWTPSKIKTYDNGFQTVIENKEIIPQ